MSFRYFAVHTPVILLWITTINGIETRPDDGILLSISDWTCSVTSVPARLGKGQGAREQPKFGHNLVHAQHIIGHSLEREWPKFGRNPARGLGTVLWAIDENMGTNLQAFYNNFYTPVWRHKNSNYIFFFFLNLGRAVYNRAGRKTVRVGRSALRNMPSWNTGYCTHTHSPLFIS